MKGTIFALAFLCGLGLGSSMALPSVNTEDSLNQETNSTAAGAFEFPAEMFLNGTYKTLDDLEKFVVDFEALEEDLYVLLQAKGLRASNASVDHSDDEDGNATSGTSSTARQNFEKLSPGEAADLKNLKADIEHFSGLAKIIRYGLSSDDFIPDASLVNGHALPADIFRGDEAIMEPHFEGGLLYTPDFSTEYPLSADDAQSVDF